MPNKKLTKAYWNSKREIISAATRGFNMNRDLPRMLYDAYPDLKAVKFGFCDKDDLNAWHAQGWEHIPLDIFDPDEFNKSDIPSRYGLKAEDGLVRWNENYLMIMGKDFRKDLTDARNQRSEELYHASVKNKKYASPSDPRQKEMLSYAESNLEGQRVQPTEDSPKPKRGRPPKKT